MVKLLEYKETKFIERRIIMNIAEKSMAAHYKWRGKIETGVKAQVENPDELSLAYTPGVSAPCLAIKDNQELSFKLTGRWNTVAVVTDGTAVLGLGDIGADAAMPVMEGKALLFKNFGNVDAVPICLNTKDVDEIVNCIKLMEGSFGGVNLEDISAPRCFEIEKKLKETCNIPIFHDDQHGTAIVVLAGLINAIKLTNRKAQNSKVVICGAGAAGESIARLLMNYGFNDIIVTDRQGIIDKISSNPYKAALAKDTNPRGIKGGLSDAVCEADIFLGVSAAGTLNSQLVKSMAKDSIIFAMANPVPEIMPDEAKMAGAAVIATGRSDFPNQINNLLAFPGVFRGVFDVGALDINDDMKMAAALAISSLIEENELNTDYIIPSPFDPRVVSVVASAVGKKAVEMGAVRKY